MHLLLRLYEPTSGTIRYGETDLAGLSDLDLARFRNRRVGFVFQFHHLLPEFSAVENVMLPLLIRRLPAVEARARALALLTVRLNLGLMNAICVAEGTDPGCLHPDCQNLTR